MDHQRIRSRRDGQGGRHRNEAQKRPLVNALGNPKNVIWTRATLHGRELPETREAYNWLRWSADMYDAILPKHEHVLFFELDSLLLRSHCVDQSRFLAYDMVGAAGCTDLHAECHAIYGQVIHPPRFMNGGFTLRKRSTMRAAALTTRRSPRWADR
mmetsp:Transcript_71635/g.197761  ORF Transcript_71635/g.197761 Transcript_71635/m.197761 type:complete len:156 (+) Transcript_71635:449-916(+)